MNKNKTIKMLNDEIYKLLIKYQVSGKEELLEKYKELCKYHKTLILTN